MVQTGVTRGFLFVYVYVCTEFVVFFWMQAECITLRESMKVGMTLPLLTVVRGGVAWWRKEEKKKEAKKEGKNERGPKNRGTSKINEDFFLNRCAREKEIQGICL